MQRDINAPYASVHPPAKFTRIETNQAFRQIPTEAFITAAKATKRQITPAVLAKYERWKLENGIQHL